jgi:hypothetical protein
LCNTVNGLLWIMHDHTKFLMALFLHDVHFGEYIWLWFDFRYLLRLQKKSQYNNKIRFSPAHSGQEYFIVLFIFTNYQEQRLR